MERKFKFSGLGARFLSSHVRVADFDDHENGLCGWLGNSLFEHVQELNELQNKELASVAKVQDC